MNVSHHTTPFEIGLNLALKELPKVDDLNATRDKNVLKEQVRPKIESHLNNPATRKALEEIGSMKEREELWAQIQKDLPGLDVRLKKDETIGMALERSNIKLELHQIPENTFSITYLKSPTNKSGNPKPGTTPMDKAIEDIMLNPLVSRVVTIGKQLVPHNGLGFSSHGSPYGVHSAYFAIAPHANPDGKDPHAEIRAKDSPYEFNEAGVLKHPQLYHWRMGGDQPNEENKARSFCAGVLCHREFSSMKLYQAKSPIFGELCNLISANFARSSNITYTLPALSRAMAPNTYMKTPEEDPKGWFMSNLDNEKDQDEAWHIAGDAMRSIPLMFQNPAIERPVHGGACSSVATVAQAAEILMAYETELQSRREAAFQTLTEKHGVPKDENDPLHAELMRKVDALVEYPTKEDILPKLNIQCNPLEQSVSGLENTLLKSGLFKYVGNAYVPEDYKAPYAEGPSPLQKTYVLPRPEAIQKMIDAGKVEIGNIYDMTFGEKKAVIAQVMPNTDQLHRLIEEGKLEVKDPAKLTLDEEFSAVLAHRDAQVAEIRADKKPADMSDDEKLLFVWAHENEVNPNIITPKVKGGLTLDDIFSAIVAKLDAKREQSLQPESTTKKAREE